MKRLGTIDALRGVAALAVAWFHFTNGSGLLHDGWLWNSGRYGWVGVEMFFVISGFIIPYSLYRSGYQTNSFGRFLLKRIVRLDPPYIVDILLCVGLSYLVTLAPGFRGEWPHYTWGQLAAHIAYANSVVHKPWVNVVFWSLGIEFQYYLLIGLGFGLLVSKNQFVRLGFLGLLLIISALVHDPALVFLYFPLFVAGILTFQCKAGLINTRWLVAGLLVTGVWSWFVNGPVAALVGIATALTIQFVRLPSSPLTNFGLISYSLYLLHVPIGGRIMNFGARFVHGTPGVGALAAAALIASVASAILFYRYVELPSQRLSSSISYQRKVDAPVSAVPSEARSVTA